MKLRSPLPQRKTRLEIIPLIDIMFFLLASFMLVSLSMKKQQTIKVDLPVESASQNEFKPDMINLAVDAAGDIYLGKNRMSLPDLERMLVERRALDAATPVYISGDENARHGSMVRLLGIVRRIGFTKVAFNVKAQASAP